MTATLFSRRYTALRRMVDRCLAAVVTRGGPKDLVDACSYVLAGGGKRVRSTLVLLACEAVGGRLKDAVDAGAAIEIMHNFTLVHDDVMDHAPSRRGRATVHVRWDLNNALLVGDVLLGLAYRSLLRTRSESLPQLVGLFTSGVIEVCEGQALDLEFEKRSDVTVDEYFAMIEKKTGRLISMATEMGALIGGGSRAHVEALKMFGHYLGRAFQLQDDLLDVVAEEKHFGKTIGGDIIEGKKTFLLLKAAERVAGKDRFLLRKILTRGGKGLGSRRATVAAVTALYRRTGVLDETRDQIRRNTRKAVAALDALPAGHATAMLRWLSDSLIHRAS